MRPARNGHRTHVHNLQPLGPRADDEAVWKGPRHSLIKFQPLSAFDLGSYDLPVAFHDGHRNEIFEANEMRNEGIDRSRVEDFRRVKLEDPPGISETRKLRSAVGAFRCFRPKPTFSATVRWVKSV